MARQGVPAEEPERAPAAGARQLSPATTRHALIAWARGGFPAAVPSSSPPRRRLRRARAEAPARRSRVLRVRRRLGPRGAALLLGARRRAADPRRPAPQRARRARELRASSDSLDCSRSSGLRDPGGPIASLEELEARFGIRYLAPRDARATALPAGSVDFVSSTSTLEHVPARGARASPRRVQPPPTARRGGELAHRPQRSLLALRRLALPLQLPPLSTTAPWRLANSSLLLPEPAAAARLPGRLSSGRPHGRRREGLAAGAKPCPDRPGRALPRLRAGGSRGRRASGSSPAHHQTLS